MGYRDEEILKARQAIDTAVKQAEKEKQDKDKLEKELEESIFNGKVHIYGEEVEFSRRRNEEYGVSIYMPTSSFELDEEFKKALYPMESRPKYVYGNETVNLVVSFNYTSHQIPEDKMEDFLSYAEKLLRATGPRVTHFQKRVIKKESHNLGVMEFISNAIDTRVFNTIFYAVVDARLLMGTIYFPVEYKERQMRIVEEMLESFEIEEKQDPKVSE